MRISLTIFTFLADWAYFMKNNRHYFISILILIGLTVVAALLAPPEASLGQVAKLVYAHAAQAWIGIIGFLVAAVLSIIFLISKTDKFIHWAHAFEKTSLLWWFIHVSSSLITMQLAWGGIFWQEPRFRIALTFMILGFATYCVSLIINRTKISSVLYAVNFIVLLALLSSSSRIMHPTNPIYGAEKAFGIKLYTSVLVVIFLIMIIQTARWWYHADTKSAGTSD